MSRKIEIDVRLPKHVRIQDVNTRSIPLDENWMATVREGYTKIDELPLRAARRKYGRSEERI